jgi:hypothetical protein
MFYRAPQLKPDTLSNVWPAVRNKNSPEIGLHNVVEGNRKNTFRSRVQEWEGATYFNKQTNNTVCSLSVFLTYTILVLSSFSMVNLDC